jgi:hypothetical protein
MSNDSFRARRMTKFAPTAVIPLSGRDCSCRGGLRIFGDAATADGFTFSHYPDPLCRPHAPDGVGILISFFYFFPLARELTDFPQTARLGFSP